MVRICLISSVEDAHEKVKNAPKMDDPFDDERRLPFTVVSCSGQDEDYPATELSKGAAGRGWQAPRFCVYPQELVIELQHPSHVLTMQLLCHEYKISSKVEIFASVLSKGFMNNNQMKRLGHLSLDPNERTGFQARELKSIQINAPASVIRLVLHSCYSNKLNVYNQVGIIALVITGDPLSEEQLSRHRLSCPILSESPRPQKAVKQKANADLSNVDSITGQKIQRRYLLQLQQEKQLAVEEEDYDEAKRLKLLIEKLRKLGQKIKELEVRKRMAVEEEDYDQAKVCKLEIEKLRQLDAENEPVTLNTVEKVDLHDIINGISHRESCDNSTQTSEVYSEDEYKEELANISIMEDHSQMEMRGLQTASHVGHGSEETIRKSVSKTDVRGFQITSAVEQDFEEAFTAKLNKNQIEDSSFHDELPADGQTNTSDEVLTPEPLPESLLKEYSDVLNVMDKYHLECLLSKHWQLRDKSVQLLERELESNARLVDTIASFRAIHKVLSRGLNDRVSNVFFSSIQMLRAYVSKFAAEVQSRELHSCLGDITSILLEKLGDSNARTREAASDMLMYFAVVKEVGLNVVAPLMLKVPKTLSVWKPILGRLQWLMTAVPKFGLQPQGRGGSLGFLTESLMHFVVHCFNYPNGEVRNAAMKVTTEVYKIMGPGVEKYLKGVKPKIREVIIGLCEKTGEDELASSSSTSKLSTLKAAIESSRQAKRDSIATSPQKGKNVIDGFERQSYPQPGLSRNKSSDRFELAQGSPSRSCWIEAGSSMNQMPRSGKPSCSAARR